MNETTGRFVCIDCGWEFGRKPELAAHWKTSGHWPDASAQKALTRARRGVSQDPDALLDYSPGDRQIVPFRPRPRSR